MQAAKAGSRMWGPRQRAGPKIPEDAEGGRHMALKWSLFLTSEDMKHTIKAHGAHSKPFYKRPSCTLPNLVTGVHIFYCHISPTQNGSGFGWKAGRFEDNARLVLVESEIGFGQASRCN